MQPYIQTLYLSLQWVDFEVPFSLLVQPDREDELLRIEGEGGKVINWNGARVFGVLAMSRAIGILIYLHTSNLWLRIYVMLFDLILYAK